MLLRLIGSGLQIETAIPNSQHLEPNSENYLCCYRPSETGHQELVMSTVDLQEYWSNDSHVRIHRL
jgi:hypothetical protein